MTETEITEVLAADKARREKNAAYHRAYQARRKAQRDEALAAAGLPPITRGRRAKAFFIVTSIAAGAEPRRLCVTDLVAFYGDGFARKAMQALKLSQGRAVAVGAHTIVADKS